MTKQRLHANVFTPRRVVIERVLVQRLLLAAVVLQIGLLVSHNTHARDLPGTGRDGLGDRARPMIWPQRQNLARQHHGLD
jgi:hypothetical protein